MLSQSDFDTQTISNMLFRTNYLIAYVLTLTYTNEVEAGYVNIISLSFGNLIHFTIFCHRKFLDRLKIFWHKEFKNRYHASLRENQFSTTTITPSGK